MRAGRSLGVVLMAIALGGCAGAATTAPSPTPVPSSTPAASTSAPRAELTATPMPTLRTAYDLPSYSDLVKLFDYDTTELLGYKVTYKELQDGVTVQDITYPSGGYDVFGKLVIPDGEGPFPAVLYAAGYDVSPSFFVPEMVAFAKAGYAGLAIGNRPGPTSTAPSTGRPRSRGMPTTWSTCAAAWTSSGTLPQVDAKRIGFVGHSLGCAAGGILSGLETRIGAYALMACGGYITHPEWSFCSTDACFSATDDDRSKYQERLAVLNPVELHRPRRGRGVPRPGVQDRPDRVGVERCGPRTMPRRSRRASRGTSASKAGSRTWAATAWDA